MTRKSPRKFTEEFKEEAVKLVVKQGYSQEEAARCLGVGSKNINRWVRASEDTKKTVSKDDKTELDALRKEVQKLRMEKEILKKAAAFFASELN